MRNSLSLGLLLVALSTTSASASHFEIPDAGSADDQAVCVGDCPASGCDAGKLGCVAANQACLLKAHTAAEKAGEPVDVGRLMGCSNGILACITKLEAKHSPAKPASLCTVTGDVGPLDAVTAIDPSYPTALLLPRVAHVRRTDFFGVLGAAVRAGELADAARLARCSAKFAGCLGKLEAKQNPEKPSSLCAVSGDLGVLEGLVEAFVDDVAGQVLDLE